MSQDNGVQSVERALIILEELATEKNGLGVTELSKRVNLHKSTVYRMLATLFKKGYVEQNSSTGVYRLGTKLLFLGGAILERMDLRKEARDLLEELSQKVNETVHLVALDGFKAVYIDKLDSSKTIRMVSQIGRIAPLHASAVGKAILAFSNEDFVNRVINSGLEQYTEKTFCERDKLLDHLREIQKQGFAVDDEEYEKGIRCIGAPIFGYTNKVIGAISVSGPTVTVTLERVNKIAKQVVDCAAKISSRMGWNLGENA